MKKAFSLAELLIALTIVGVVAVLTVPHVMRNAFLKSNIATLQQTYTKLSENIKSAMLEERIQLLEDLDLPLVSDEDTQAHAFIKKYFDISKDCGGALSGCFADAYKDIEGNSRSDMFSFYASVEFFVLANGAAVALPENVTGYIFIDSNNVDPPNVLGRDLFVFHVDNKGNTSARSPLANHSLDNIAADCKTFNGYWISCLEYLEANNWSMDY